MKNGGYPSHFRATSEKNKPREEKSIRTRFKEYVFGILTLSEETEEEKTHNKTVLATQIIQS